MTTDLFAAPPPPRPRKRRVASFVCYCGAQDEVREPAPDRVDCWSCKRARAARRWTPGTEPPFLSARKATPAEVERIGKPDDVAEIEVAAKDRAKPARRRAETWKDNPGERPRDAKGRRVRVKLRLDGNEPIYADARDPMAPPGWTADHIDWSRHGGPFEVLAYLVIR